MSMVVSLMEYAIDAWLQLYRINLSFYDIREVFLIAADRTWAVDIIGLDGCKLDEAQDITEQDECECEKQKAGYRGSNDEMDRVQSSAFTLSIKSLPVWMNCSPQSFNVSLNRTRMPPTRMPAIP